MPTQEVAESPMCHSHSFWGRPGPPGANLAAGGVLRCGAGGPAVPGDEGPPRGRPGRPPLSHGQACVGDMCVSFPLWAPSFSKTWE